MSVKCKISFGGDISFEDEISFVFCVGREARVEGVQSAIALYFSYLPNEVGR